MHGVRRGAGAVGFAVGERVWCNSLGHAGRQGAAAEFAVVAADRLYHLPAGVDPVVAAAIAHPGATAYLALILHGRLAVGETLFVGGGAGHVGSAAIVLGSRAGARVIASARAEDLDHCRGSGAAVALDYRAAGFADALRGAAPDGVDVHLETSGHHDLGLAVDVLADRGRIVVMAGMGARPVFPPGRLPPRRPHRRLRHQQRPHVGARRRGHLRQRPPRRRHATSADRRAAAPRPPRPTAAWRRDGRGGCGSSSGRE